MNLERFKSLVPIRLRAARTRLLEKKNWIARHFAPPSPSYIKRAVLLRNGVPDATWVETGTYLGDTTQLLSQHSSRVITLEPDLKLYMRAKRRFSSVCNVEVINGLSETIFPGLLPQLHGKVNFWLDGHYSGGITHQGLKETPIEDELRCIQDNLGHFSHLAVLVDDVRCFNPMRPEYAAYPSLDALVDWARTNNLSWHIEHDIFVARSI